jgi:hypothetical protein
LGSIPSYQTIVRELLPMAYYTGSIVTTYQL